MVIATGQFTRATLAGQVVVVTGAGGGIGYEAARALAWLGARVVVAEVNAATGQAAAEAIGREFGAAHVRFVPTDVGDEASVARLAQAVEAHWGPVDAVLNNATLAPLGRVHAVALADWDASYRVNLRGPVLLARAFLPGMLARNRGAFICVSSTGTAYLGAYETFKAAQVHLANTLDAELEGTGVAAFTIGPGLIPTPTALAAVEQLAPQLGMSLDEFYTLNKGAMLTIEEAGAGFAAAVARAQSYRGQEISSMQALKDAGLALSAPPVSAAPDRPAPTPGQAAAALADCQAVRRTLAEQVAGWKQRSLFERQWVIRDFKKTAGMPAERWLEQLGELEEHLARPDLRAAQALAAPLDQLVGYYRHLADLARGYEKDPAKLAEALCHLADWQTDAERLAAALQ